MATKIAEVTVPRARARTHLTEVKVASSLTHPNVVRSQYTAHGKAPAIITTCRSAACAGTCCVPGATSIRTVANRLWSWDGCSCSVLQHLHVHVARSLEVQDT